jgi:phenylalanyl-tRNA synthetase alpha chain
MSADLASEIRGLIAAAEAAFAAAADEPAVEAVRVAFLGRKGQLPALSQQLGKLTPEERPAAGSALNEAKQALAAFHQAALDRLRAGAGAGTGASIDVTLPGHRRPLGRKHPVNLVIDECVGIFRRMGFIVAEGPEIETVRNNFDALNTPADHPSRDPLDTFYFTDGRCLRTQTSPVQIRVMERQDPPVRIIAPGRCFRCDTPDATHSANFHQIEGLYVDRGVSMADLKSVLLAFAHELCGDRVGIRLRPHFFPFTEPSVEVDFSCFLCGGKGCRVCKHSGWIEIAGAGMVDPNVLTAVGYDPEIWSGYAFGMGIERIAMIRYGIGDIRNLYENDLRFVAQF